MDRQVEFVEQAILRILAVLLSLITVGVFAQVVLRYSVQKSFLWGEELSTFAFVWCIFLGAVVNVRRRTNFAFEFFTEVLPGRWATVHRLAIDIIIVGCSLLLIWLGWQYAGLSTKRLSPALGISLVVPAMAVPVAGFLMAAVGVRQIAGGIASLVRGGDQA
jgi:TRAP-type transport system small permease protein